MPAFAGRRFWAFVLSVAIGRPAIQTRFRGLSGIIAGRLYLRGVIKLFRQKYLIAHPQLPVEQLDGWLLVQPGTTADVKPSSRSGKIPRRVIQAKHLLCSNGQPLQVGTHRVRGLHLY